MLMPRKRTRRRAKGSGGYHMEGTSYVYVLELPKDPATGRRVRRKFKSVDQSVALQKFNEAKKKLIANGTLPSTSSPMLRDWLDRWLTEIKAPTVKPRVAETYRSDIRNITASIGAIRLDDLTAAHVRQLEHDITAKRSAKTALNAYRRLSNALADAIREGLCERNACIDVDPPRVEANPTVILDAGQPSKLIESAETKPKETKRRRGQTKDPDTSEDRAMWRLMWRVAFETGMRQGERFAIRPIDLVETDGIPAINVCHELQRYKTGTEVPSWLKATKLEGGIWLVPPKSHRGVRMVPVSRDLWDDLRKRAEELAIPPTALLFTRRGHPLTNPVERRRWDAALDAAGLPRVTIRSARHWFATRLAMAGASEDARKAIMGHVDIATTAGYTHWTPQALGAITGAVVRDFGPDA